MKKSILNIGTSLTREEQREVNGGTSYNCAPQYSQSNCDDYCTSVRVILDNSDQESWENAQAESILSELCGVNWV